jgi:hypothetical protein
LEEIKYFGTKIKEWEFTANQSKLPDIFPSTPNLTRAARRKLAKPTKFKQAEPKFVYKPKRRP